MSFIGENQNLGLFLFQVRERIITCIGSYMGVELNSVVLYMMLVDDICLCLFGCFFYLFNPFQEFLN